MTGNKDLKDEGFGKVSSQSIAENDDVSHTYVCESRRPSVTALAV
jgi:hypothetical protein